MLSMVVQANLSTPIQPVRFLHSEKLFLKPFRTSFHTSSSCRFSAVHYRANSSRIPKNLQRVAVSFTDDIIEEESDDEGDPEKLGVLVKPIEKPRLTLKFIWMEKNIGIALDHMIPGYGSIPLSPYYFWPRKDAWEELKELLESKPWISQKQMIILLNQATDIINLWQQGGGSLA